MGSLKAQDSEKHLRDPAGQLLELLTSYYYTSWPECVWGVLTLSSFCPQHLDLERKNMCAFHFGMIKILHLCWWPKVPWKLWNKISACCLPRAQDRGRSQGLVFEGSLLPPGFCFSALPGQISPVLFCIFLSPETPPILLYWNQEPSLNL